MKLTKIQLITPLKLTPVNDTYWQLSADFKVDFHTDDGVWRLHNKTGWLTDLRSGCDAINIIAPKWGNEEYTASVLAHDTAYSGWLSFNLANDLLAQGMVLSGQIGSFRAGLVKLSLDTFGRSHYSFMDDPLPPPYSGNRSLESFKLFDR